MDTNRLDIGIIESARRDARDFVASQVDANRGCRRGTGPTEGRDVGDLIGR